MKLIEELGMVYVTGTSKSKERCGIYECPFCLKHFKVRVSSVKSGRSTKCKSCATRIAKTTHGLKKHKLYRKWKDQRQRCNNSKATRYKDYGGRGIKLSEEFNDFPTWLSYVESLPNACKPGYSIDRINNDGNYERDNLRWASREIQARNTRRLRLNNTSGYRGVVWSKDSKKWCASISIDKKGIFLGYHTTALEAAIVYDTYIIENKLEHTTNGVV